MIKLEKIIFLLLVCIHTESFAQKSWKLDACIDHALAHNLRLNDLNYTSASEKEKNKQSYREFLPTIEASASYDIQYGRSVDPNTNQIVSSNFFSNNYFIRARLDLFNGFQRINTIAATKFLYKASLEEYEQEKYLLAFSVMSAFYDVQFYNELLQISKEQVVISERNRDFVKKQVDLGMKAGADLYEAEAIVIGDELIVTQNENNLKTAKLKLIQEMNLENVTDIEINAFDTTFTEEENIKEIDSDTVYNKALSFMPIIKSQEFRVKAAQKDVSIARGSLYPTLSFSAGYQTGYFETNVDDAGSVIPFSTQTNNNASQFIGLSLRIPISERWSNRSEIKQKKIALLQRKNDLKLQQQELNKVIQELTQAYEASKVEYSRTKQSEASQATVFAIAQKRYEKGLISILELRQAKTTYAVAQSNTLQVKLKLQVQQKTLDFYMGLPVFNINKN
ncbi:TolC family protein [uncultured Kordia sp.]|uniref:TolC family protein n=1 Tax=uncultured Kordia sp. TaxID=507699 RepID=UPI00262C656F|nr:TolC family protein [uncultured Kordia sp.]